MGATDKAKSSAQRAKGKVKETAGAAIGDEQLRRKGKADQVKARLKQTGERIKDVFRR